MFVDGNKLFRMVKTSELSEGKTPKSLLPFHIHLGWKSISS